PGPGPGSAGRRGGGSSRRLRAGGCGRRAGRDPPGLRLRGTAGPGRPRVARAGGSRRSRRLRPLHGVVRAGVRGVPRVRPAVIGPRPGECRGRHSAELAPLAGHARPGRLARALRGVRRRCRPLREVRLHRRGRRHGRAPLAGRCPRGGMMTGTQNDQDQQGQQNPALARLSAAGVSVWLDDLSRTRLESGSLARLIETRSVVGVTTNPTIFAQAIASDEAYAAQLTALATSGADAEETIDALTVDDVRAACDLLRPVWERTDGVDGRVSLEVSPRLAHEGDATIEAAVRLAREVDRPNVLIKIPATEEGVFAIPRVMEHGVSVN